MNTETSNIDINLEEFDKNTLINLILYTHKFDYTFNEAVVKMLTSYLDCEVNKDDRDFIDN